MQVSIEAGDPPVHIYPESIVQVAEQPLVFVLSLSSHSSAPTLNPSLHTVTHAFLETFGPYPLGQVDQVSEEVGDPPVQI